MKNLLICFLVLLSWLFLPQSVYAQNLCNFTVTNVTESTIGDGTTYLTAEIQVSNITIDGQLQSATSDDQFYFSQGALRYYIPQQLLQNGQFSGAIFQDNWARFLFPNANQEYNVQLVRNNGAVSFGDTVVCSTQISKNLLPVPTGCTTSTLNISTPSSWDRSTANTITVSGAPQSLRGQTVYFYLVTAPGSLGVGNSVTPYIPLTINSQGSAQTSITINTTSPEIENGSYQAIINDSPPDGNLCALPQNISVSGDIVCKSLGESCVPGEVVGPCGNYICNCSPSSPPTCTISTPPLSTFEYICDRTSETPRCQECEILQGELIGCQPAGPDRQAFCDITCGQNTTEEGYLCTSPLFGFSQGIATALGCVPFENLQDFAIFALRWSASIVGGMGFLLLLYAAVIIATSSGNPDQLKVGREQLTAAIAGILMVIFSIFILRLIGVNILGIL